MRQASVMRFLVMTVGLVVGLVTPPGVTAQNATPIAATPLPTAIAGGVPCTDLFGIATGNACVIFLQASPDAGPIDVYFDDELVLEGLAFGSLGDFIPVATGADRRLQVVPSGATPTEAIIDTSLDLGEGIAYEIAVMGPVADAFPRVLAVDTRQPAEEVARVRVVHAAPDGPSIDVAVAGGEILVEDLEYPDVAEYSEVPTGLYDLEARVAGTTDLALPLPGIVLAANTVYTIYVIGQVADGSLGFTLIPVLISPDIAPVATPTG
ncbi:MAG TPA: DUF4397 domain-containing protein [Thermomicrobiales bacterium]|nr:DUF4397 domain-containing protein [Thermomicrobiales bacterium]